MLVIYHKKLEKMNYIDILNQNILVLYLHVYYQIMINRRGMDLLILLTKLIIKIV